MKSMKYFKELSVAVLMFCSSLAVAGNGSSGGGGSFVCRDGDKILSAVSQDVWNVEIKNEELVSNLLVSEVAQYKFLDVEKTLSYNLIEKLFAISPKFYEQVKNELEKVLKIRQIMPIQLKLQKLDSSHYKMPFCKNGIADYINAAVYDKDQLVYSEQVVMAFTRVLDWAALNTHEAIYKVLRDEYKDKTSDRTQEIVGQLVIEDTDVDLLKSKVPLSEFNPDSTKSYEEKFKDLVELFNNGEKLKDVDLKSLGNHCYTLNLANEHLNPVRLELIKINVDLKGNVTFEKEMSYDYLNPIMGKIRMRGKVQNSADVFRDEDGGILYSSWYNSSTSRAVPYYFSKDQHGNLIIALRYSPGNLKDPFLLTLYDECLEYGGFLKTRCVKFKEYNILKKFPRVNPLAMMFCPVAKSN